MAQLGAFQRGDLSFAESYAPLSWVDQAIDQPQCRRLAGAGPPDNGDHLGLVDPQGEMVDGQCAAKPFGEIFQM